ncbi:MAG: DUF4855 domain-containing protein [Thermicanus sp.]|nr:DUF4855 domain-containing protein [Thermicanus sp.]
MPYLSAESVGVNNHILVCPYLSVNLGGEERIWTEEDLLPHLFYLHQGKVVDRFFGGVLFEAPRAMNGETLSPLMLGLGKEGTKEGWEEALGALFRKDANLSALLKVSKRDSSPKGTDLWIALPYPHPSPTAFSRMGGRKEALIRWIRDFMELWRTLGPSEAGHRVRLCGFAWTKSSIDSIDEALLPELAREIHALGLKWIWLQNYGTAKAAEGKGMGFDAVFVRPTYLGEDPRGERWILSAARWASFQQFGLILWGDERVSSHQMIDFLNAGQGTFMSSFQIYEVGEKGIIPYYQRQDPLYVYLYAYTKGAYARIPVGGRGSGKEGFA